MPIGLRPLLAASAALAAFLGIASCDAIADRRAAERTARAFLAAAARGDSAEVIRLADGTQPRTELAYLHWLRPDFLAAAAHDPPRFGLPSIERDIALVGFRVAYRDTTAELSMKVSHRDGQWRVQRIYIPEFFGSRPGDPDHDSSFARVRAERWGRVP